MPMKPCPSDLSESLGRDQARRQRLITALGLISATIWIDTTFIESLAVDSLPGPISAVAIVGGPIVGAAIPWLAYPFLTRRRGQT
jgi:hypothetical protein